MHRTLIVLVTAILISLAAPGSAQDFNFCARANLPGGGQEGIVIGIRAGSLGNDIVTFSGDGFNRTFGQPVTVWGACSGGQCSIGMKGTPVDGFPFVRESGGSFPLAGPFGGNLQVFEFLPGSGQTGSIRQFVTPFTLSAIQDTSAFATCP